MLPLDVSGMEDNSRPMGKPTICIGENKGADQLRNCKADQRLCFRYMDSTIPLLSKSKISCLQPSSVLVQLGLCQTWSETTLLVFPRCRFFHEVAHRFYTILKRASISEVVIKRSILADVEGGGGFKNLILS